MPRVDMENYVVPTETRDGEVLSGGENDEDAHRKEKYQQRVYFLNRAGSGEAHYLILEPNGQEFLNSHVRTEMWNLIKDISSFGAIVVDNYLYVIGGFNGKTARHLSRVTRYDPIEDIWTEKASMPTARAKFGLCELNGNIYVSGGEKIGGKVTAACEVYNIKADRWIACDRLPSPRADHSCIVHGDIIYLAGGHSNNQSHSDMWIFEDSMWTELDNNYPTKLPICLDRFSMICVNNTIYFIGGVGARHQGKSKKQRHFTRLNTISYNCTVSAISATKMEDLINPWNFKLPDTHFQRHSAGTIALGRKIYLFGGSELENSKPVTTVESFNTETNQWEGDIRIRKGDISDVVCFKLGFTMPIDATRENYRLKWVMW